MISERPILFSGEMVRAVLDGRKTHTRRIVRGAPAHAGCARYVEPQGAEWKGWSGALFFAGPTPESPSLKSVRCPYGKVGDRLWVRETWAAPRTALGAVNHLRLEDGKSVIYAADGTAISQGYGGAWRPSIFMPRWASRITLEIAALRVERLQNISEMDAYAEGVRPVLTGAEDDHRQTFRVLWDSINAKRVPWAANPWVWVIAFKRVTL